MQLYIRPFYNILIQQKKFEWTTKHQKRFEEIKTLLTEQLSNTIPNQINHFMLCATPPISASAQHITISQGNK